MAYTLQPDEPVSGGIRRIIDERVETAIEHIDGDEDPHETVHAVRKRCKEVRAALRLVRPVLPTYSEENAHYRDAARRISAVRDAQAAVETFDTHLRPAAEADGRVNEETLGDVQTTLADRRDGLATDQTIDERLASIRADLVAGRDRLETLQIEGAGYDAVAGGLRKSYKRARNRMADAYDGPEYERFHEWRKRVEYHRDHTSLLASSWEGPMGARRGELQTLTEVIGDETDLAEFVTTMHEEELFTQDTREKLTSLIDGRRSQLQRQARPLGERLFAEAPAHIVARFEQYWHAPEEIDHDASDLSIADSRQARKPKPKPKPDPESSGGGGDANGELPSLMQRYSDKWYRPDSDTYEYTVRTPDGNRAYRKTVDGAVGVIRRYYESETDDGNSD